MLLLIIVNNVLLLELLLLCCTASIHFNYNCSTNILETLDRYRLIQ